MLNKLRYLDFDDFLIISLMQKGLTQKQIGIKLSISTPAICHRMKKHREHFGQIYYRDESNQITKRFLKLSKLGKELASKIDVAIEILTKDK